MCHGICFSVPFSVQRCLRWEDTSTNSCFCCWMRQFTVNVDDCVTVTIKNCILFYSILFWEPGETWNLLRSAPHSASAWALEILLKIWANMCAYPLCEYSTEHCMFMKIYCYLTEVCGSDWFPHQPLKKSPTFLQLVVQYNPTRLHRKIQWDLIVQDS